MRYIIHLFLVLLLLLINSCQEENLAGNNSSLPSNNFFQLDFAVNGSEDIIKEPSEYTVTDFREMRERSGMFPEALKERLLTHMPRLKQVFNSEDLDSILEIGYPAWNRSRNQSGYGKGETLIVPLVKPDGVMTEGLLIINIAANGELSWSATHRKDLLAAVYENRAVANRAEYVYALTLAGMDHYLYNKAYIPEKYFLDPHDQAYNDDFTDQSVSFRDPIISVWLFGGCYRLMASNTEDHLCCRYICESIDVYLDYIRGIPTDPPGGPTPPDPDPDGPSGGNPTGPDRTNDGLLPNGLCEWLWPTVGIYSGTSPSDDFLTVIGDNPQLCYFYVGTLGTIHCDFGMRQELRGGGCTGQAITIVDQGSSVAEPRNGDLTFWVYARYSLYNSSSTTTVIGATLADLIGINYEWTNWAQDEWVKVHLTRFRSVTPGLQCYDACVDN